MSITAPSSPQVFLLIFHMFKHEQLLPLPHNIYFQGSESQNLSVFPKSFIPSSPIQTPPVSDMF